MNLWFIFIQIIGFLAWILLALSFYRKTTNKILILQVVANLLFCLHYFLLDGYSGLFICMIEILRDFLYYLTTKDNHIFIISTIIYIICIIVSYTNILDLFPYIASTIDGFFLTKKRKIVVFGAIITYTLWFIYDMYVKSYSGAITDAIIIVSNLSILLFNFDIFKGRTIPRHGLNRISY